MTRAASGIRTSLLCWRPRLPWIRTPHHFDRAAQTRMGRIATMSGRQPFANLLKDFTPERLARVKALAREMLSQIEADRSRRDQRPTQPEERGRLRE